MRDAGSVPVHVRLAIANWPEDAAFGAVAEFCRQHGLSRSWFYALRARAAQGEGVVSVATPRSRRPKRSPTRVSRQVEDLAIQVRADLIKEGWDGGPVSVHHRMLTLGLPAPSRSTLARIFARRGVSTPSPAKRPRSSLRFAYDAPNECWQLDGFEHRLADGTCVWVLQVIDDHSRRVLASLAAPAETADAAQEVFQAAIARVGVPQRVLTDNAPAFNPVRRGKRGRVETWLRTLGVQPITSRIGHPQTQGKAERHHQTSQRWLAAQPAAKDLQHLQQLLNDLEDAYNQRPHQSLGMLNPLQVWAATPVAPAPSPDALAPLGPSTDTDSVHRRTIDIRGMLYIHQMTINVGTEHAGVTFLVTVHGPHIQLWDSDGLHFRTVTTTPGTSYYGNGRPTGRRPHNTKVSSMS